MSLGVIASAIRLPALDRFSSPDVVHSAYGVRRLLSSYTASTKLLRLREDGGDTESDFGWDSKGDLDTAAISTFLGVNSGFVVTWYDQSGNGRDITQGSVSLQPGLDLSGARPLVSFLGAADEGIERTISSDAIADETNLTVSVVLSTPSTGTQWLWSEGNSGSTETGYSLIKQSSNLQFWVRDDAGGSPELTLASTSTPADSSLHVCSVTDASKTVTIRIDGTQENSGSYTDTGITPDTFAMGYFPRNTNTNPSVQKVGEWIARTEVDVPGTSTYESNAISYYGI